MGHGSNHCKHDIDENYCHICRDEITQEQSVEIERLKAVAIAAKAVLRDALDRVDVHLCDEYDDQARARGLLVEMKALYDAMMACDGDKLS